jgi:hypothetical protein
MATVRFSGQLIDEILSNARKMFDTRLEKVQKNYPEFWGDTIHATIFQDYIDKINSLPNGLITYGDEMVLDKIGDVSLGLQLKFSKPRPMFNKYSDKDFNELGIRSNYGWRNQLELDANEPRFAEIYEQAKEYRSKVAVVEQQRDAFIESVKQVVNAHATLAPALKMWSALWDLVPQQYKDRHMEVVERTKKEIVLENVDLNSLTATVTLNKLTGSA